MELTGGTRTPVRVCAATSFFGGAESREGSRDPPPICLMDLYTLPMIANQRPMASLPVCRKALWLLDFCEFIPLSDETPHYS